MLGVLGIVLCVAVAVGFWYVEWRVGRARKLMFGRAERSLAKIGDRIAELQKVTAQSKITIEELRQRTTELTKTEMRDRLSARLDLDPQVQSLFACVRQADLMLEVS
jgi:hypothetical protein